MDDLARAAVSIWSNKTEYVQLFGRSARACAHTCVHDYRVTVFVACFIIVRMFHEAGHQIRGDGLEEDGGIGMGVQEPEPNGMKSEQKRHVKRAISASEYQSGINRKLSSRRGESLYRS